ncbi:hypothetical protein ACFVHI_13230 [Kitasatospora sp. NPDC127121]|uniref:hypothetical protein n=1 Tax=unclassified Kitasatospora TaxID=2633591 RepID=UPI00363FFCFD
MAHGTKEQHHKVLASTDDGIPLDYWEDWELSPRQQADQDPPDAGNPRPEARGRKA